MKRRTIILNSMLCITVMILVLACSSKSDVKSNDINVTIKKVVAAIQSIKGNYASHEAIVRDNIAQQIPNILTPTNVKSLNKEGIDAIAALLEDDDDLVRLYAADALGFIGAPAKYTIPALQKALNKEMQKTECSGLCGFRTGWDSSDVIPGVIAKINQ